MYEITKHYRDSWDGKKMTTYSRDICTACTTTVEAGSTGFCGGDSGHGCRTMVRFTWDCADVRFRKVGNDFVEGIEIQLGGDCELDDFIDALEFAAQALKDTAGRED